EGVAARSGVAKTTIYRRWRVKDELAPAAVWNDLASGLQAPRDVGDTRELLRAFLAPVINVLQSPAWLCKRRYPYAHAGKALARQRGPRGRERDRGRCRAPSRALGVCHC